MLLTDILTLLFLVSVMLSIIHVKPSLFLSVDHKVISHFMINIVEVDMRQIVL